MNYVDGPARRSDRLAAAGVSNPSQKATSHRQVEPSLRVYWNPRNKPSQRSTLLWQPYTPYPVRRRRRRSHPQGPQGRIEVLSWNWTVQQCGPHLWWWQRARQGRAGRLPLCAPVRQGPPPLAKQRPAGKQFPKGGAEVAQVRRRPEGLPDHHAEECSSRRSRRRVAMAATSSKNVTMSYKDIEFDYKPQDDKGGQPGRQREVRLERRHHGNPRPADSERPMATSARKP